MGQRTLPRYAGVIAHSDADGMAAASVLKMRFPAAQILFSRPSTLHKDIKQLEHQMKRMDELYILDIAINAHVLEFVQDRLRKIKERNKVFFFDHHTLPNHFAVDDLRELVTDVDIRPEWSTSAIAFAYFYGEERKDLIQHRRGALLGAIGALADYARGCPHLLRVLDLYDEAFVHYQAFLLKQASRRIESEKTKRWIIRSLAAGMLPSEITEIRDAAAEASREQEAALNFIEQQAFVHGDIGIVLDCPVASMGHNAHLASTLTDSLLGIAASRVGGMYDLSLRRQARCKADLSLLTKLVVNKMSIVGGGEAARAGFSVPSERFEEFLDIVNENLPKATPATSDREQ